MSDVSGGAAGLGRDAVPQRGGGDRRLHREDPADLRRGRDDGEIVVCDNGSTDRSVAIAESMGARVVHQPAPRIRQRLPQGLRQRARTLSRDGRRRRHLRLHHDSPVPRGAARDGCDFVTGSRYLGGGDRHITALHRWFGNPALTGTLNTLFSTRYTDVYCGFRAFSQRGLRADPAGESRAWSSTSSSRSMPDSPSSRRPGDPDRPGARARASPSCARSAMAGAAFA